MRTKKTFCFYSTGIECDWKWIRSSIGKIGVYSPGLFLHTPERFQFSETGVPGIWFHFILLTKRPKPVCLPAEKCKPDHRLSLMLCQEGACTCVVNTERCIPFCIPLMHTVEHEDREREKVTEWDWQRKGEMGQGCHDMWLRHPRMHAQVKPHASCCSQPLALQNGITLAQRSTVLICDKDPIAHHYFQWWLFIFIHASLFRKGSHPEEIWPLPRINAVFMEWYCY